jgi:UPF0755 protein
MPDNRGRHRAQPVAVGPRRQVMSRIDRIRDEPRKRRRRIVRRLITGLLTLNLLAAVVFGFTLWQDLWGPVTDYSGGGKRDLVIEIHPGDSTTMIAEALQQRNVVATAGAFLEAAHGNNEIAAIQPGFYRVRTEIPAASAVQRLTDPENRVGKLVIPEGSQLDDTTYLGNGKVTPGILSLISKATCVDLNGDRHCVQAADLRTAASTAPLGALAVPAWATERVTAMGNGHRRIEGLIAPGTWNIKPWASAPNILATLIRAGTDSYEQSGLQATAAALQMSPYDVLVVASLVQRESQPDDFGKVARVIYNRLRDQNRPVLEFDSTVNYPLDRREVPTTDADRAKKTPWNTYVLQGLPATPICSPSAEALNAAERPEPGDWLYFVTVDSEGTTLFTDDYQQHLANIELAQQNGVLDSSR